MGLLEGFMGTEMGYGKGDDGLAGLFAPLMGLLKLLHKV